MKGKVIVTGAAGFIGAHLTEQLTVAGYKVIAVVRPGSIHNSRVSRFPSDSVTVVPLEMSEIERLPDILEHRSGDEYISFYHLALHGGRNDFNIQLANTLDSIKALETADKLNCRRFICTGSQAEYGVIRDRIITEDIEPNPFSAYGAAKVAICHLTRVRAVQLGIDWVWGRIFSVIGQYEPFGRMLPDLIKKLQNGESMLLSSCEQNWDYLDAIDAAQALIALAENGKSGEIYNIANGDYHKLKYFTELVRKHFAPEAVLSYGTDPDPFVSLQPSIEKITEDTGWIPKISFIESLKNYT